MNGLDKIIEKIISEAKEKAKACEDEANNSIQAMKEKAMDDIMRMENVYISRAEKASEDIILKAESSSSLEARNVILKRKTDLVDEAFSKATDKILKLPKAQYAELISGALVYAIKERISAKERLLSLYGEEEAELDVAYEVIFNKKDITSGVAKEIFNGVAKLIDKKVRLVLSTKVASIDGGFILKCNDIEINCSLSTLVNEARERCEARVIKVLF